MIVSKQTTSSVLMVRPASFRMNEETAVNNYYQKEFLGLNAAQVKRKAQEEFDGLVEALELNGVEVCVVSDTDLPVKPDALFPNNWISTHADGTVVLYPMFAPNRRVERREDILDFLEDKGFVIENVIDYSSAEDEALFLEGTGSMVLDRENRKAYVGLSERADEDLLDEFCDDLEYMPVVFEAFQSTEAGRKLIYHTNVMMSIGVSFALVCLDAIDDKKQKKLLVEHLKLDGKEIVVLSENQIQQFAGNMLLLHNNRDEEILVMSTTAYQSLTEGQLKTLSCYAKICHAPLDLIETCGGGSARCMIAEIFLPRN